MLGVWTRILSKLSFIYLASPLASFYSGAEGFPSLLRVYTPKSTNLSLIKLDKIWELELLRNFHMSAVKFFFRFIMADILCFWASVHLTRRSCELN